MPSNYSEATLVQQTTAECLEQQFGWEVIYAYNEEGFGPSSLLGLASNLERQRPVLGLQNSKLADARDLLPRLTNGEIAV